jgi:cell wall-associated NlpC family hydrolase
MGWQSWLCSLLIVAVCGGCASTTQRGSAKPPARPLAAPSGSGAAPTWAGAAALPDVALTALGLLGTPYRFGGSDPRTGFDCSGFVGYVFRHGQGLVLPRRSEEMGQAGTPVEPDNLQAGDLVFFNTLRRPFSHVGLYLGGDKFIHAPTTGGEVRIENMKDAYWARRYDGARRMTP